MRKAKLDNERTRRIMLSRSMSMSVIDRSGLMNEKVNDSEWAVAVTPPSSPEMEADRAMPIKRTQSLVSPVMTRSTRTRALSIGLQRRRSFPSFFEHNNSSPPNRSVYYSPTSSFDKWNGDIFSHHSLHLSPGSGRHLSLVDHRLRHVPISPKLFSKNPEERIKQRCHFTRRPSPSWKSRHFVDKNGGQWSSHPGWHRIMRDEYKFNGLEDTWRDERNRFFLDLRRDRQFMKQSRRRFSLL